VESFLSKNGRFKGSIHELTLMISVSDLPCFNVFICSYVLDTSYRMKPNITFQPTRYDSLY